MYMLVSVNKSANNKTNKDVYNTNPKEKDLSQKSRIKRLMSRVQDVNKWVKNPTF